eukprot:4723205-Pleurochrysis_carterae.AAC.1
MAYEAATPATYDDTQLLSPAGGGDRAVWRRAQTWCAIGVLPSLDGARLAATDVAHFVAAAGGDVEAADAVADALAAAIGSAAAGSGRKAEAGRACLVALGRALDALSPDGVAAAAKEARMFREEEGVGASAGARGVFVARALRAQAATEAAVKGVLSPSQESRARPRRSPRGSPPMPSHLAARTRLADTPRSAII